MSGLHYSVPPALQQWQAAVLPAPISDCPSQRSLLTCGTESLGLGTRADTAEVNGGGRIRRTRYLYPTN